MESVLDLREELDQTLQSVPGGASPPAQFYWAAGSFIQQTDSSGYILKNLVPDQASGVKPPKSLLGV